MPSTTIPVWGCGREGLWSYGNTVNVPDTYDFIEPGDHYVTRQIKLRCDTVYEVRKKGPGYSKVVGYWAPKDTLEAIFVERDRVPPTVSGDEGKQHNPVTGERHASETSA